MSEACTALSLDYPEQKERCRGHRLQAHPLSQALDAPRQPVDQVVASMFVEVVGPQFPIRFGPGEHMEGADNDGVGHRENRPLFAPAGGQALLEGRPIPLDLTSN